MTRKDFLANMIKSILGYSTIEFKSSNNHIIKYLKTGTLLKDCTYTKTYYNKVVELICSIFNEDISEVKFENKDAVNVGKYRENAKHYIKNLIGDTSQKFFTNSNALRNLELTDLNEIYREIIIEELFNVEKTGKDAGYEDFFDSKDNIICEIRQYLENLDYNEKKRAFINYPNKNDDDIDIFYKSSELGKKYYDINEYVEFKKYKTVVLQNESIKEFEENTVYRYSGNCFFDEGKHDDIIVYFMYNDQRIESHTSYDKWLNKSLVSNYAYGGNSRALNCYFIYDQGKVFKFLQISEANNSLKFYESNNT